MSEPVNDVKAEEKKEEKKDDKATPQEDKAAELTKYKVRRVHMKKVSTNACRRGASDRGGYCAPSHEEIG